jgi:hypothetical protein
MFNLAKPEIFEQEDGATWHLHDIDDGHLLITSRGLELIEDRPEIKGYLDAYWARVLGGSAVEAATSGSMRNFIASGARSSVYEIAPGIAVKEADKSG